MKTQNIVTILIVAFLITSCAPIVETVSTETTMPTSTVASILTATSTTTPIPSSTPTPIPLTIPTLTNCVATPRQKSEKEVMEIEIYSALINLDYMGYIDPSHIFIDKYTVDYSSRWDRGAIESILENLPSLEGQTFIHYIKDNQQKSIISPNLCISMPYTISNEGLPHTNLSKIGFNDNFDQALVYMGHVYYSEGGGGAFYLLTRDGNNKWQLQDVYIVWSIG